MTMLAGFQLLLGRLSGQTDVVVGIPVGSHPAEKDGQIACTRLLPVRARWQSDTTTAQLLASVRERLLKTQQHVDTTLDALLRLLAVPHEPGRIPLVEVQFGFERLASRPDLPGLQDAAGRSPLADCDLALNVIEGTDCVRIDAVFNADLFEAATILRWIQAYEILLSGMSRNVDAPVATLPILSDADNALMARANRTSGFCPQEMTVDGMFASQAARVPDRVAIRCGRDAVTYRQLNERATRIAHCLQLRLAGSAQIGPIRIGVLLERSTDLVASLLGVMRAGMTYIPLDPTHPSARLKSILQQSGAALILTSGNADPSLELATLDLQRDADEIARSTSSWAAPCRSNPSAYVIFTSGSTGTPKGVEIGQRALVNFLLSMSERPGFGPQDCILSVTTVAFDIAALELFLPLIQGGQIVIATKDELRFPPSLLRHLRAPEITMAQATPSLWRLLLDSGFQSRSGLRMLCGGEALDLELAQRLLAGGGELWNMYGPTETTIWSALARVEADGTPITVGTPIANTGLHILDVNDQPVPVGVIGELWISGAGLALGYLGRPELTEAAFRTISINGIETRAYRTGDLARWTASGSVVVLGRRDSQVKLRGFRVELGEIEATVLRSPAVATCAVALQPDHNGTSQLVCYYVLKPGQPFDETDLEQLAATTLPGYMIPSRWVRLDSMALNASGKLDRKALPSLRDPG
jgi:amino acid adenylation domain-containing protein